MENVRLFKFSIKEQRPKIHYNNSDGKWARTDETIAFKSLFPKALCACNFAELPPPGLSKRGITSVMPFYSDVKVILPLIVATVALVAAAVIVAFRWRNSESDLTNLGFSNFSPQSLEPLIDYFLRYL